MADPNVSTYLIIGAGVFGASTAYHLAKTHPDSKIVLMDRTPYPCPVGASYDLNKIIRADYSDITYAKLALEALEEWKKNPLFNSFFHQSGMLIVDNTGLGQKIIKNYASLNTYSESTLFKPEKMKELYDGIFANADYQDIDEVYSNPLSGWAEATAALKAVLDSAIEQGVKYIEGDVSSLILDSTGKCDGVQTKDGRNILAEKVILCTGAGTAKLLVDSAPDNVDLHVGPRMTAVAVVTGNIKLNAHQMERFKKVPVFIHNGNVNGQVLPPTSDAILKFCVDESFTNGVFHNQSNQILSSPPEQDQSVAPAALQAECQRVVCGIYGKELEGVKCDSFRICWDAITPTQDFIIGAHPHCERLYIATAGSFHGWKFLPIIGHYVVQMLDSELDGALEKRWAWDRPMRDLTQPKGLPKRDLKNIS
ncbi:sarcosine oxidase-like protein [Xylogone sp. PMI_703]|nr:sarcosine oxidase-like protein [Xylogone sp. PMI_703]